jgi:hypothetical protein
MTSRSLSSLLALLLGLAFPLPNRPGLAMPISIS